LIQDELDATQESLETTIEELQSPNEELEAINEELQSTNEELETMNDELCRQHEEAGEYCAYAEAILQSVGARIVVLGPDRKVRSWNRWNEHAWGLRAEEVLGQDFLNLDIGLPVARLRTAPVARAVCRGAAGRRGTGRAGPARLDNVLPRPHLTLALWHTGTARGCADRGGRDRGETRAGIYALSGPHRRPVAERGVFPRSRNAALTAAPRRSLAIPSDNSGRSASPN
jgi:hypothetical protein